LNLGDALNYLRELWLRANALHDELRNDTSEAGKAVLSGFGWKIEDIKQYIEHEAKRAQSMTVKPARFWLQDGVKQVRHDEDTPSVQGRVLIVCACTSREEIDDVEVNARRFKRVCEQNPNLGNAFVQFLHA
jgi:hypothetical protein